MVPQHKLSRNLPATWTPAPSYMDFRARNEPTTHQRSTSNALAGGEEHHQGLANPSSDLFHAKVWSAGVVVRELLTGWRPHEANPDEEPLCMVQRLAGQLITPETWPGCGSQPHPAGAGTRASGNALRIDPAPKRVPWPLGQGAVQLLQHLLALRPEDRCSDAEALQSR